MLIYRHKNKQAFCCERRETMKVDIFNTSKKYDIIYADPPWKYNDMLVGKAMHGTIPYETRKLEIVSLH